MTILTKLTNTTVYDNTAMINQDKGNGHIASSVWGHWLNRPPHCTQTTVDYNSVVKNRVQRLVCLQDSIL